jgi:hypothetical protein
MANNRGFFLIPFLVVNQISSLSSLIFLLTHLWGVTRLMQELEPAFVLTLSVVFLILVG